MHRQPPLRLVWDRDSQAKQDGPEIFMAAKALSSQDKSVLAAALLAGDDETVLLAQAQSANRHFCDLLSRPGWMAVDEDDARHGDGVVAYRVTETGRKLLPNVLSTLFRV